MKKRGTARLLTCAAAQRMLGYESLIVASVIRWQFRTGGRTEPLLKSIFKAMRTNMTKPLAIIDFDFARQPANPDLLIQAWMPEIERAAITYVPDDRFIAFLTAALRLGARSKTLEGLKLMDIIQRAGYSRSTFFRLLEGYTGFLLQGYQLTCRLSVKVYEQLLFKQERTLDEFCTFTADIFYGVNCTMPHEILQMLWKEHSLTQLEFHPHLLSWHRWCTPICQRTRPRSISA